MKLLRQSAPVCFPEHRVLPITSFRADMLESEERERLRFPFAAPLPPFRCISAELDDPRLFRMQFQRKLAQSLPQLLMEAFGILSMLEPHHEVICVAHDDDLSSGLPSAPRMRPLVERVVQIDVCQQW